MTILLARHGQTTGDLEKRYGGTYDDHLTGEGQRQADNLATLLDGNGIQRLYATPLIRGQETAERVGAGLHLPIDTLQDFRERNSYGILSGLVKTDAAERYPDQVALLGDVHNTVQGAEPYTDFKARIEGALASLAQVEAEKVAVITHGGPIKLVFREILKLGETEVGDCGFAVIEATDDGQYRLQGTHDIDYL